MVNEFSKLNTLIELSHYTGIYNACTKLELRSYDISKYLAFENLKFDVPKFEKEVDRLRARSYHNVTRNEKFGEIKLHKDISNLITKVFLKSGNFSSEVLIPTNNATLEPNIVNAVQHIIGNSNVIIHD